MIDIQIDLKKVTALIEAKSTKEQQAESFIKDHGGVDSIFTVSSRPSVQTCVHCLQEQGRCDGTRKFAQGENQCARLETSPAH